MSKKQTLLIVRITLFLGTFISLYFVPWIVVKAWLRPLPETLQKQVEEATGLGFEGIIVYVDQAGQSPAHYAAGWHDRANKIPAYPEALFKIASINKLYYAVALVKLANKGHLSLDKTLGDYFPGLREGIENADLITLRMLIQHRSGIPNFTATPDFWNHPAENEQQALERILGLPANFAPGTKYEYSNTNYLLIGQLIELASGKSKFQYIQDEILLPLGLTDTYASIGDIDMEQLMGGYYVGVEEDIKASNYGSMIASAADVGAFLRALNDGSVFAEGEQELYSSLYKFEHTGLIPGYQSIARYHSDLDAVVVQFTNTTDFDGYHWNVSEVIYGRLLQIMRSK